jgi:hypothetical protein
MTGPDHYRKAEELTEKAHEYLEQGDGQGSAAVWAAVAQIHATLALVTYGAMHDGTTLPLRRDHHRKQGWWRPTGYSRVRRGGRARGISQSCQHRECAHGGPGCQRRHRPGRRSARGRRRRPGRHLRCAQASGCVIHSLMGPLYPTWCGGSWNLASRWSSALHVPHHSVRWPSPALAVGLASWFADAWRPGDFLRHTGSKRMSVRAALRFVGE